MSDDPKFRSELKHLEERLEEVLDLCSKLTEENRSLRDSQEQLVQEKATLVQRNEQVRTRVEGMITRLKSLEQGQ
ncbi:MAG: TIGR02449 family protein [Gammaproteobacteria bacterium]|nr:TIGR02449 family protein [Gammaproteobacteria bacterium]